MRYFDSTVGLTIALNRSSAANSGFTALGNAVLLRFRGGLLSRGTSFATIVYIYTHVYIHMLYRFIASTHMFERALTFLHSRHVDVDLAVVMSANLNTHDYIQHKSLCMYVRVRKAMYTSLSDLVGRLAPQQLIR